MLFTLLSGLILLQGAFGYPPLGSIVLVPESHSFRLSRTYFDNFNADNLNPFNWIGNTNVPVRDATEIKLEALYKIVECLTRNGKDCVKILDEVKSHFEKPTIAPETNSAPVKNASTALKPANTQ